MNNDQLKGKWMQFKGELKTKWGRFTDDDILQIKGDYEKFAGKARERYGDKNAEVLKWTREWLSKPEAVKKAPVRTRSRKNMAGILVWAVMLAGAPLGAQAATVQTRVSDSWITAKTKMSLAADGRVKGRQVSVETQKGEVVLRGKVDTSEAKAAAGEIAGALDDVSGVKNELQVVAPSKREAVEERDDVIVQRVKKEFAKDRALRKAGLGVVANAGVVSLTGTVPDFVTSAKASWEAWKVSGVKSVKNDLTTKEAR